jgi:hypothetical protein
MAVNVFISYSTRDLQTASALQQWIRAAGASVFLAAYTLEPGRPIARDVEAAIRACDLFVLLWSDNARGSEWVPQEIGLAKGANREIMPVVLHDGLTLPVFISDLKYLPLHEDPEGATHWLHDFVLRKVQGRERAEAMFVMAGLAALLFVAAKRE